MYNFGQFRRSQLDTYMTALNYDFSDLETISPLSAEVIFLDKTISLSDNNILQSVDSTGTVTKSYYLRFKIYKLEQSKQLITIKLKNDSKDKDNEQIIKTIEVESGAETDYSVFDLVIKPNSTYNHINFILNRIIDDYNTIDRIHYVIKDRNDDLLDIPVPVYISFIISVM